MVFLKKVNISKNNIFSSSFINSNVALMNSDCSFMDLDKLFNSKSFTMIDVAAIYNNSIQYLDEMFLDDVVRSEFEEMLFRLLERDVKRTKYFFVFKISNNHSIRELKDLGFIEWLYYTLLFCRASKVNFSIIYEGANLSPIAYQVTKELNNPRLGLGYSSNVSDGEPEDVPILANLWLTDPDSLKGSYTEYTINNFKGDQL